MNDSRYDKIPSTSVQITIVTINERFSYCVDLKMAFVWLLDQPSTPQLPIDHSLIQGILSMKFQNMPLEITHFYQNDTLSYSEECNINIRGKLHCFTL